MKYIISNGMFVCKDNEQPVTTNSISGTLVGFRVIAPENGSEKVQIDLKDTDDEGVEQVNTLTLRKYGDASLKILRCLFGIAEIISGKVLTISLEEREGHSALIHVGADSEELPAAGCVEPYAYDKKLLTDKIIGVLKRCLEFKRTILVYTNADKVYPETIDGDLDVTASAAYIKDLRRSGRSGEILLTKTTFTQPTTANGYEKALRDLASTRAFRVVKDEADIDRLWAAYTDELEENDGSEPVPVDDSGHEVEL